MTQNNGFPQFLQRLNSDLALKLHHIENEKDPYRVEVLKLKLYSNAMSELSSCLITYGPVLKAIQEQYETFIRSMYRKLKTSEKAREL